MLAEDNFLAQGEHKTYAPKLITHDFLSDVWRIFHVCSILILLREKGSGSHGPTVAFTLAWRPRLLAPLVAWAPASRASA